MVDFPDGSVVKNPPANAEDTGSIPSTGRLHMPRGNCWARTREPHTEAAERKRLEPARCNKRKPACNTEDPAQTKKKKGNSEDYAN